MTGTVVVVDEPLMEVLTDLAASLTGFNREAILPDAIRRVVRALLGVGIGTDQILDQALRREPSLLNQLRSVAVVGETFFFRQPEHFEVLRNEIVPARLAAGLRGLRAWSAGCATGEEAYSLAACLLAATERPSSVAIEVVGTDLLESNIEAARQGVYSLSAVRSSSRIVSPIFGPSAADRLEIDETVRAISRFETRNLLDSPPIEGGLFDVILCRNVMVYFSAEAIRTCATHLAAALAPGGVILFGPVDMVEQPRFLVLYGPPELQMFSRPSEHAVSERPSVRSLPSVPSPALRASTRPPVALNPARSPTLAVPKPPEPIAIHLRALFQVERGDHRKAEAVLTDLHRQAPEYIPGIMEKALLHLRNGERHAALDLMREVLRLASELPPDDLLAGPEPLPVRFYTSSVWAFLQREGKEP